MKCEKDCFEKKRVVIESCDRSMELCVECPKMVKQSPLKSETSSDWAKYLKWILLGVGIAVLVGVTLLLLLLGNADTPTPVPSESPTEQPFELKQVEACWSEERVWTNTTVISVPSHSCNSDVATVLDLSAFKYLKRFTVGDECFMVVKEVKMIGLDELECVEIGESSFTKEKEKYSDDSTRHFCLKNCPKLRSLKMGRYSFSDYKVIEIENVDALEVIEMGDLNEESFNFAYASLELKSILIHNE